MTLQVSIALCGQGNLSIHVQSFHSIAHQLNLRQKLKKVSWPTFPIFSIGDGGWAFDGIEMTSMSENDDGQMVVNCMSTHLTSFAVLVDVSGSLSVSFLYSQQRQQ